MPALTCDPDATRAPDASPDRGGLIPLGPRYLDLGLLGRGGMGEVRRVQDQHLGRVVALKRLNAGLALQPQAVARFIEEARVAAGLQHPGILPVYDIDQDSDGTWYFTMPEIRGRTLAQQLRETHAAGHGLRRLVETYLRLCEAVAYAHAAGVVHRDLKPANVMVGPWGEVLVLDWGLAAVREDAAVHSLRGHGDILHTRVGAISGTPAYMAPEQALGQRDRVGPHSDVYALGVILLELICGQLPRPPRSAEEAIPLRPPLPSPLGEAPELEELWRAALRWEPSGRPADAGQLVQAVRAWLDGDHRRERALHQVEQARALLPPLFAHERRAADLGQAARHALQALPLHAGVAQKEAAWALEDEARHEEGQARHLEEELLRHVHAALQEESSCVPAHQLLAERWREAHDRAEAAGDRRLARSALDHVRRHDRGPLQPWLAGEGWLSFSAGAPGQPIEVQRYEQRGRRLEPMPTGLQLQSPVQRQPLPMGSYRLVLRPPAGLPLYFPVQIGRMEHWEDLRPGAEAPLHHPLPESHPPGARWVPAGWFRCGSAEAECLPPRRVWVDAFWMQSRPVSVGEYLAFVNDQYLRGAEVAHLLPQRVDSTHLERPQVFALREGRYSPVPDEDGVLWDPSWPILRVNWHCAMAYARWWSEQSGWIWRLPTEVEWEKAARGVDGRRFPWGDHFEAAWCRSKHSRPHGQHSLGPAGEPETDQSPYGMFGMAGNVSDWCLSASRRDPPEIDAQGLHHAIWPDGETELRNLRGGSYSFAAEWCRTDRRQSLAAQRARDTIGFRLLCEQEVHDHSSIEAHALPPPSR